MKLIPEILLVSLFLFLYLVFVYAKDNFILLRKNITLEYLFNISFVGFLIGIISARIVYVLEHLSVKYLNPLVLFLFPYFPGLSVAGGVIGFSVYLFWATKQKKFPFWNIFDIFSLSLFFSFCIGELLVFLTNLILQRTFTLAELVGSGIILLFFVIFSIVYTKSTLKDGSLGFLILSFLVLIQNIVRLIIRGKFALSISHMNFEDLLLGILFLIYFTLFIQRQVSKKK